MVFKTEHRVPLVSNPLTAFAKRRLLYV